MATKTRAPVVARKAEPPVVIENNTKHPRYKEVSRIAEGRSEARTSNVGGYPDDWMVLGNLVIVASVDHDDGPELTVQSVDDYLKEAKEQEEEYENDE